ncbi:MAG TPA: hypothetical protein VF311_00720 [Terriglobales bacterium]
MLSARRLYLLLFLSAVLGCAFSLSAHGESQDQSLDKSAIQKEKGEKSAKKQSRAQAAAQLPAVLRRDPGDIASLDLVNGAGGAEHAPHPGAEYIFVKEDMNGTSPKFYVKDDGGDPRYNTPSFAIQPGSAQGDVISRDSGREYQGNSGSAEEVPSHSIPDPFLAAAPLKECARLFTSEVSDVIAPDPTTAADGEEISHTTGVKLSALISESAGHPGDPSSASVPASN